MQTTTTQLEEFKKELAGLINKYSLENISNTPDYILSEYLVECLFIYGRTAKAKQAWWNLDK